MNDKLKIGCPKCGSTDTKVVNTRGIKDKNMQRRRRCCHHCLFRFTTVELEVDDWKSLNSQIQDLKSKLSFLKEIYREAS